MCNKTRDNTEKIFEKKTIETKPKDGFVREADIHELDPNNYRNIIKGILNLSFILQMT